MKIRALVLVLLGLFLSSFAQAGDLVISQVYGGGGNAYNRDYVEIFNRGAAPVSLTGLTLQYASATGSGNFAGNPITTLSGTLQPGQYFLARLASTTGGSELPGFDATGSVNASATGGKFAIVNSTTGLACNGGSTSCTPEQRALILDLVGWGAANFYETAAGPATTSSTALLRKNNGCTDSDNNSSDFTTGTPAPRYSGSTLSPCSGPVSVSISPTTLPNGTAGTAYSQTLTASPAGTYAWSVTVGALPTSLSLSPEGVLSGTPSASGPFSFTVQAFSATLGSAQQAYTVNIAPAAAPCLPTTTITQIQGTGNSSPLAGNTVTTSGVVTALRSTGYFLQMATSDNPAASSGLFVYTNSSVGLPAVGSNVCVQGKVQEYDPGSNGLTLTELAAPITTTVVSTGANLPAPVTLTELDLTNSLFNLEKYEGMLVKVNTLTVVAPSDGNFTEKTATGTNNGVFFGVVGSTPRPFREPGIELPLVAPAGIPVFDANPERLRVDSDAITGVTSVLVSAGQTVTNLVGPLDYGYNTYTIYPTSTPLVSTPRTYTAVPTPSAGTLTVGGANVLHFYDDVADGDGAATINTEAYQRRLQKISRQIRDVMKTPDILGLFEVEHLKVLNDIAAKVNSDSGAANPNYVATLLPGNDVGSINIGFLSKSGLVTIDTVTQHGKTEKFTNPDTNQQELLHDRPPLQIAVRVAKPGSLTALKLNVIAVHMKSLIDVDTSARNRAKRLAGAESVARIIQNIQAADPAARILVLGDFNAFEVNDGYVDVVGIITGRQAPASEVTLHSDVQVSPALTVLSSLLPAAERYSYTYNGNAQSLDHSVANEALLARISAFAYGRANADFPVLLRGDATRPEGLADHDPEVTYITLPDQLDATSQIRRTNSGLTYNRLAGTWTGTLTITNTSASPIAGPVYAVFSALPAGVTMPAAAGANNGAPYLVAQAAALAPGASITIPVKFKGPSTTAVSYTLKVVAGTI